MASTINADTSNGVIITPDTSGEIELQANGVTKAKVTANGLQDANGNSLRGGSFRNLIINGDMRIAQRGTSVSGITSENFYTVDRWRVLVNGGTWTQTQDTDVPTGQGFGNSVKILCTTANPSPSAANVLQIRTRLEGQNLQHLKYGTASAEKVTFSFWIKSNKTGTYVSELYNADAAKQVSKLFTINSADTWEKKTITYDGDTVSGFDNDNGNSLQIGIFLSVGTDYTSGTLQTTWASASNTNRAVGQVNLADSTSNYINITGVQLEVGEGASDFEHLTYDVQLQRCQRYYQRDFRFINGFCYNSTTAIVNIPLKVTMRSSPTLAYTSGASTISIDYIGGTQASSSNTIAAGSAYSSPYSVSLQLNSLTGRTAWQGVILISDTFGLSSEL